MRANKEIKVRDKTQSYGDGEYFVNTALFDQLQLDCGCWRQPLGLSLLLRPIDGC
jgi:hypothetical protein